MFQLLQSVLKATQTLLICKGSRFQLQGLWPLNAAFLGPVSAPPGGQLDGEPARGTLSVTAGGYTSHSNSFAHRAEGPKGEDLCGAFTGNLVGIWVFHHYQLVSRLLPVCPALLLGRRIISVFPRPCYKV